MTRADLLELAEEILRLRVENDRLKDEVEFLRNCLTGITTQRAYGYASDEAKHLMEVVKV